MSRATRWTWLKVAGLFWLQMAMPYSFADWCVSSLTEATLRRLRRYAARWDKRFGARSQETAKQETGAK